MRTSIYLKLKCQKTDINMQKNVRFLLVLVHVALLREGLSAELAAERLEPAVDAEMRLQIGTLSKSRLLIIIMKYCFVLFTSK